MKTIYRLTCFDKEADFYNAQEFYSNKKAATESYKRLVALQIKKCASYNQGVRDQTTDEYGEKCVVGGRYIVCLQDFSVWKNPSTFF